MIELIAFFLGLLGMILLASFNFKVSGEIDDFKIWMESMHKSYRGCKDELETLEREVRILKNKPEPQMPDGEAIKEDSKRMIVSVAKSLGRKIKELEANSIQLPETKMETPEEEAPAEPEKPKRCSIGNISVGLT